MIILLSIYNPVNAKEIIEDKKDITTAVEIRYKWYKEKVQGDYYPLQELKEGYISDDSKIKYGPLSNWNESNCNLPGNYYLLERDTVKTYRRVEPIRFVKLENFIYNNNIEIFHNNEKIDFTIVSKDDNTVVLNLIRAYYVDNLTFYIKNESDYKITLYKEKYLNKKNFSKQISNKELLIPDETWITAEATYENYYSGETLRETAFTKFTKSTQICRYQEIYAYKYKIEREYYDDNYHLHVDGYIKDEKDYQILYQEDPIINTVEITTEKIIKEPKIEYVYIPSENNIEKIDSSKEKQCIPKIETQIKKEIQTIEKEIYKIPKKIYLIITILILIIIILLAKLMRNRVD